MKKTLIIFYLFLPCILFAQKRQIADLSKKVATLDTARAIIDEQTKLEFLTIRDRNKKKIETGYLQNGIKTGLWTTFQPKDSLLKTVTHYENDKKEGLYLEFGKRADLVQENAYVADKKNGVLRKFANGRLVLIESYKMDILDGKYQKFYKNGKKEEESFYRNGEKHGTSTWYYDNEQVLTTYSYDMGKIVGSVKSYYKTGEVKSEMAYRNNELDGMYQLFYENEQVKVAGTYLQGQKHGEWTEYDKAGKKTKITKYNKGEVTKEKSYGKKK
ncbi:MAG: toxin-antitoxin system YwqK family antitoxin [Chitinophagales bacterium]